MKCPQCGSEDKKDFSVLASGSIHCEECNRLFRRFAVAYAFMAECCNKPHVVLEIVEASDPKDARQIVLKHIEGDDFLADVFEGGFDPDDMVITEV